ncbi:MAG: Fur family transcriptional regulator [Acholeplasmataceae bacterium]
MRLTTHRKTILALLKNHKKPLSAEQIMRFLAEYKIDLSTIYRALDIMHTNGHINKSLIDNTAYYYLNQKEHHHFVICLSCKKMEPIDCLLEQNISSLQTNSKYKIIRHDLTFYGYCSECQQNNA